MTYDVVIIGSGPAALTAAIYTSRASLSTLVLAGKNPGGQLMLTTEVENYPGFPEGILGPELMDRMRKQAERFGAQIKNEQATKVDFSSNRSYKSHTSNKSYISQALIAATGASTRWLGVPGEAELIGRGVSSCAPCDAFFYKDKEVIVVGGGDSAMEEALVLTKFARKVTIVHRRGTFRASKIMADRALKHPKIKVLWNSEVIEILGEEKLASVKIKTRQQDKEVKKIFPKAQKLPNLSNNPNLSDSKLQSASYRIPVDGLFVAIGHIPNTDIFKGKLELDKKGYIKKISNLKSPISNFRWLDKKNKGKDWKQLALKYPTLTSVEGVFVAGDVHDYRYRQAITATGYGCQAAMDAERWLEEK